MSFNTETNQSNSQDLKILEENQSKERVKAGFSVLDHMVKIYNSGETYIKRGLTLFGLGSILAGASFGGSQQLPSSQQNTAIARPSIIYVQVPTQKVQPLASVSQVASQKLVPAKSAPMQIKTPTPTNRTIVNPKPTSTHTIQPLTKVPQRVTTQKIVRAKSAPVPTNTKTPVRPVARANRKVAPSTRINANTPKQVRSAIALSAAPRKIVQKAVAKPISQVNQAIAPLKPTNKNN